VTKEVLVEKIIEVEVEKPYEKIVEREVEVERIVERVVEVPVEVDRIVHVEVPFEKIVHVEMPVERIVYKDVPVPVQMSNERVVVKEVRLYACERERVRVCTRVRAHEYVGRQNQLQCGTSYCEIRFLV
jgi:hypothetical protein